ncbi:kinase-like domain-containing protein [Mycena galericulata]|nr:kinase-like domain-containing protein [Mycena galericulata]
MSSFNLPDLTGQVVDQGRFDLTEILGAGTYGVVYKALDTTSHAEPTAHYAVKCLGPVPSHTTQGSRHEIPLHSRCSAHPNIVTLYHSFCHQGYLFIVLELSAGGHLFDAISGGAFRQNETLVRDNFLQLVDKVQFCHESGVYHRDLKPENILCRADGRDIRIADFGLATDCALPSTSAGWECIVHSLNKSESCEPWQSDAWALCIILLNMMSGLYPWHKALDSDATYAAFLNDGEGYMRRTFLISDELNELLGRCFHPVANARPTLLQLRAEFASIEQLFLISDGSAEAAESETGHLEVCDSTPLSSDASSTFSAWRRPSTASSPTSAAPFLGNTLNSWHLSASGTSPTAVCFKGNPFSASWQNIIARFFFRPQHHDMEAPASKMPSWNAFMRLLSWMIKTPRGSSCVPFCS